MFMIGICQKRDVLLLEESRNLQRSRHDEVLGENKSFKIFNVIKTNKNWYFCVYVY